MRQSKALCVFKLSKFPGETKFYDNNFILHVKYFFTKYFFRINAHNRFGRRTDDVPFHLDCSVLDGSAYHELSDSFFKRSR